MHRNMRNMFASVLALFSFPMWWEGRRRKRYDQTTTTITKDSPFEYHFRGHSSHKTKHHDGFTFQQMCDKYPDARTIQPKTLRFGRRAGLGVSGFNNKLKRWMIVKADGSRVFELRDTGDVHSLSRIGLNYRYG